MILITLPDATTSLCLMDIPQRRTVRRLYVAGSGSRRASEVGRAAGGHGELREQATESRLVGSAVGVLERRPVMELGDLVSWVLFVLVGGRLILFIAAETAAIVIGLV